MSMEFHEAAYSQTIRSCKDLAALQDLAANLVSTNFALKRLLKLHLLEGLEGPMSR